MPSFLFYLFALITLGFGAMVVICRNPVASALSLVMSFVGLAGLFISLDAYFIGAIQILVYAGAVMVLFLFIIMLLDIKAEAGRKPKTAAVIGGAFLALVFSVQVFMVVGDVPNGEKTTRDTPTQFETALAHEKLPTITNDLKNKVVPDAKLVGQTLFQHYPMQIQLMGALLLVGTIGVVILSKREVT